MIQHQSIPGTCFTAEKGDASGGLPTAEIKLTARETEVIALSAQGLSEKEIGSHLGVSPNTVRIHIENAKRRLRARNKVHAVAIAIVLKIISPSV